MEFVCLLHGAAPSDFPLTSAAEIAAPHYMYSSFSVSLPLLYALLKATF